METVESSEMNSSAGKTERKKTSLSTSRSKVRKLRRSHAAVDNDHCNAANYTASAVSVKCSVSFYVCLYCSDELKPNISGIQIKNKIQSRHSRFQRPFCNIFSCDLEL